MLWKAGASKAAIQTVPLLLHTLDMDRRFSNGAAMKKTRTCRGCWTDKPLSSFKRYPNGEIGKICYECRLLRRLMLARKSEERSYHMTRKRMAKTIANMFLKRIAAVRKEGFPEWVVAEVRDPSRHGAFWFKHFIHVLPSSESMKEDALLAIVTHKDWDEVQRMLMHEWKVDESDLSLFEWTKHCLAQEHADG